MTPTRKPPFYNWFSPQQKRQTTTVSLDMFLHSVNCATWLISVWLESGAPFVTIVKCRVYNNPYVTIYTSKVRLKSSTRIYAERHQQTGFVWDNLGLGFCSLIFYLNQCAPSVRPDCAPGTVMTFWRHSPARSQTLIRTRKCWMRGLDEEEGDKKIGEVKIQI